MVFLSVCCFFFYLEMLELMNIYSNYGVRYFWDEEKKISSTGMYPSSLEFLWGNQLVLKPQIRSQLIPTNPHWTRVIDNGTSGPLPWAQPSYLIQSKCPLTEDTTYTQDDYKILSFHKIVFFPYAVIWLLRNNKSIKNNIIPFLVYYTYMYTSTYLYV